MKMPLIFGAQMFRSGQKLCIN